MLQSLSQIALLVFLVSALVRTFRNRNMPRVGGKMGRRTAMPDLPVCADFADVECREITTFCAPPDEARYPDLKTYLRKGVGCRRGLMRIYRSAACNTRIEIPVEPPDYPRIEAAEALALLRELPDPRLVRRLQLSDEPSFLDPWVRRLNRQQVFHLGHATSSGIVVLYRPDRSHGPQLGLTLLHEWLHLVGYKSARHVRRFRRADTIERMKPLMFAPVSSGSRTAMTHEVWSELGETLLGYDEAAARQAALAAPVHAMIVWRRVEKILRKVPVRLRSSRIAVLNARAAFMHREVAPKARAAKARAGLWLRLRSAL